MTVNGSFVDVQVTAESLGHWCYIDSCHRSARVLATRVGGNGIVLPMRYCVQCARERGIDHPELA